MNASQGSETWATIRIVNNLAQGGNYFGVDVTDDQIWLYLSADPGGLSYINGQGASTPFTASAPWVQLSQVKGGNLYAFAGTGHAALYAVIYAGGSAPANPPAPVPNPPSVTDYAYAALEWDFSVPGYQNVDTQNIDQFSFTTTLAVKDQDGHVQGRTGFVPGTTSEEILVAIQNAYGSAACAYPNPAYYPQEGTNCANPTSASSCTGLPSTYETAPAESMGRMTQQISVMTNLSGLSQPPFRWIGSSKSELQTIPGTFTTVLQLFGHSFNAYLAALFEGSPNSNGGYYFDYSGNNGYSFCMTVTQGANGYYGMKISKIRTQTGQTTGGPVDTSAGTSLAGEITILANGAALPNKPIGCPVAGNPGMNQYGLWTDRVIGTGATPDCNGIFGAGPVVTTTIADYASAANQSLIATIFATLSTALNYGVIMPTWLSDNPTQGTNYYFANTDQASHAVLFRAGEGYSDLWSATLWQFQDLSRIAGTLYSSPLYISTFGDRFSSMSPQIEPVCLQSAGSTVIWVLGATPTTAAIAIANMQNGIIFNVQVLNPGSGYIDAPTVSIESPGNGGMTAQAVARIANGAVTEVIVTNPGSQYDFSPQVSFT